MQRNATQCNAMQRNAMQCNATQRNAMARMRSAAHARARATGYVNFCPMSIDETPSKYSNMLATAIHEARAVA
jgi:hypothetical protein